MALEGPLKEFHIQDVFQLLDLGRCHRILQIGDDVDLLLGVRETGQQPSVDDPEAGEQHEHEDHRRGGGQTHQRIAPEALPGTLHAERDKGNHW